METQHSVVTASGLAVLFGGLVAKGMKRTSYAGYRFPPEIIRQAVWLYLLYICGTTSLYAIYLNAHGAVWPN
jgi:hypothetical protein